MLKRSFDIVASSVVLAIAIPVILPLSMVMAVNTGSLSPIFKQKRMGLNKKPFTIYKIKTMSDEMDYSGTLLSDDKRTSRLAALLRKSRLDELPQLFNVLVGDMSIVGPRPAAVFRSIANDDIRHRVRPVLTGPSQINNKNILSRAELLQFDHDYVRNNTLSLDLKICLITPYKLLKNWETPHFRSSAQACNDKQHLSYK